MSEKRYLPKDSVKLIAWLLHFADQLGKLGGKLPLSADEIAAGQADARFLAAVLQCQIDASRFAVGWTQFKKAATYGSEPLTAWPKPFELPAEMPAVTSAGVLRRIAKLVFRIKTSTGYSEALGEMFGIVGADKKRTLAELAQMQPALEVTLDSAGHPRLRWKRRGFTGVDLEVDRGDGAGFVRLANIVSATRYLDMAALPSAGTAGVWRYRAIYRQGDDLVGQWSNEVQITVTSPV